MGVRDIPTSEWREFLQDFSSGHRAWLATVDNLAPDIGHTSRIERPLQSVSPAFDGGRVVGIEIRFQADSEPLDIIRIAAPMHIRVDETREGTARGLEIVDRDGECTRIRFRVSPPAEMLDGVAPGELPG